MTHEKSHLALLGLGSIIIIWWLLKHTAAKPSPTAQAVEASPSIGLPQHVYPNIGPVSVPQPPADSVAPYYMGYNSAPPEGYAGPPPNIDQLLKDIAAMGEPGTAPAGKGQSTAVGGSCQCNNGCPAQTSQPVGTPKYSAPVIQQTKTAVSTFQQYSKMSAPVAAPSGPASPFIYSNTGVLIGYA